MPRALPEMRRAAEMNPNPPEFADMPLFLDHYFHGRYEQALVFSRGGVVSGRDFREPLFLAATLGQLGRVEEARPALEDFSELWGELCRKAGCVGLDIDSVRRELIERHAFSESLADKLIEGLKKAGLKEAQRVVTHPIGWTMRRQSSVVARWSTSRMVQARLGRSKSGDRSG